MTVKTQEEGVFFLFGCFVLFFKKSIVTLGLTTWRSGKESACQYRRCKRRGFGPWVRKILRESIPRQVDKKSKVPKEEKAV